MTTGQSGHDHSLAIRQEIQRFESVHPSIYAIYDLIELVPDTHIAKQIREHVVAIEDSFVNSHEWTLARDVPELHLGIIGSSDSGKSALVHRYLTGSFMHEESPEDGRFKKEIFINDSREVGMIIGKPLVLFKTIYLNDPKRVIENYFDNNKKLKLIIVVLPDSTDVTYGNVKKISEIDVGVLTQCIKLKTLKFKATKATLRNILLKINSKLNGVNHTFDRMPSCLSEQYPCMLIGADVTHPSPDSRDVPSIAAVAASTDKSAFRYNVALRLQPPKEEIISDLEKIVLSQLEIFFNKTKCVPRRIIYYRDGVSEGQLPQIMCREIEAIKKAITAFSRAQIEITCMVVKKRHHVRLFPEYTDDKKNGNVRVGTIVDTTITHPHHIDFYLVSHASIQGTARPTKYRCICNESKFSEDQLEQLTYYLCHIYARCARSVSYPAPTYYAHLGAYRGRAFVQGTGNINLNELEEEQKKFIIKMEESPMFFV